MARQAQGPTQAYGNLKQAVRDSWENGFARQLDLEAKLQSAFKEVRAKKQAMRKKGK